MLRTAAVLDDDHGPSVVDALADGQRREQTGRAGIELKLVHPTGHEALAPEVQYSPRPTPGGGDGLGDTATDHCASVVLDDLLPRRHRVSWAQAGRARKPGVRCRCMRDA